MNASRPTEYSAYGMLVLVAVLAGPAAAVQRYTITDLGAHQDFPVSQAKAINAGNQVVGTLYDAAHTQPRAFLFSGATMTMLDPTATMTAQAINDAGGIVGAVIASTGDSHAFAYDGAITADLFTLGGPTSYALGINRDGLICGASTTGDGFTHAFVYEGGVMYDIHVLAQATEYSSPTPTANIIHSTFSQAHDVNDTREVVGYFTAPDAGGTGTERAFFYKNEQMTELGSLGGADSRALAISNNGHIVGWSLSAAGVQFATMFYTNGQVRSLGMPTTTATWSAAYDVNDSGVAVGAASDAALVYTNGATTDLNTLIPSGTGWTLLAATGINNAGRIVGYGTINSQTHAFMLTPTTGSSPGEDGSGDTSYPGTGCGTGVGVPLLLASLYLRATSLRRRRP